MSVNIFNASPSLPARDYKITNNDPGIRKKDAKKREKISQRASLIKSIELKRYTRGSLPD